MNTTPDHLGGARRGQAGFTLIELLVTVGLLAVLTSIVLFAVGRSTDNARVSACRTELAAVRTAIAAAKTTNLTSGAAVDNPDSYLDVDSSRTYYTWTGLTDAWTPDPVGTPPSGC